MRRRKQQSRRCSERVYGEDWGSEEMTGKPWEEMTPDDRSAHQKIHLTFKQSLTSTRKTVF
jgi:hypothetical protein